MSTLKSFLILGFIFLSSQLLHAEDDTLRLAVVRKECYIQSADKQSYKSYLLSDLSLRNELKIRLKSKNTFLSLGLHTSSDPTTVRFLVDEISYLKIKNYNDTELTPAEKAFFKIEEPQTNAWNQVDTLQANSVGEISNISKLCILVFQTKKLVWYVQQEYPKIQVEDFSVMGLRRLAETYQTYDVSLKFDDRANSEVSKTIITEFNNLNLTQYEFEEMQDQERIIALQLINSSKK